MILFIKRHCVKPFSCVVILVIVCLSVMAAFPAAALDSSKGIDVFFDIVGFIPPVGTVLQFVDLISDFNDWLEIDTRALQAEELLVAWREFIKGTGLSEDEFSEYWNGCINDLGIADERLIMIEETVRYGLTLSDVIAYAYAPADDNCSLTDKGEVKLSAEKFQEIVNRLSEQYSPKNTGNRHSWQTDKAFVANGYGYISFFSEGTFCNSNLTDVYMLGFYYQGDKTGNYFYGLLQYHFYQTVTQDESGNNVVSLYCDYWNWFNDTDKTTVLISDELATYRYARICARPDGRIIVAWFKTRTDFFKVTNQTQSIITIGTNESDNTYNLTDKSLNTRVTWIEAAREHSGFFSGKDNIESNFISANNADIGYFYSNAPINMGAYDIDFTKMPDDYSVIANGDNIYDYSIVDNSTGDTTTINNYINNNYVFPDNNGGGGSGGGTQTVDVNVGGNVNVGGKIEVGGKVEVDVNVNVMSDNSSNSESDFDLSAPTVESLDDGRDELNELIEFYDDSSKGISSLFQGFYGILPPAIANMIPVAVAAIVFLGLVRVLH